MERTDFGPEYDHREHWDETGSALTDWDDTPRLEELGLLDQPEELLDHQHEYEVGDDKAAYYQDRRRWRFRARQQRKGQVWEPPDTRGMVMPEYETVKNLQQRKSRRGGREADS